MKIVCGLGNPGARYANTRHNVGFLICEGLAARLGASFERNRFRSHAAVARCGKESVLLLKPQTFMNRSGEAVGPAMRFYRAEAADLLVVHDDADLPPGAIRIKEGGGNAGHKGLISIQEHVGSAAFCRLRYGIGRSDNPHMDLADFVLEEMSAADRRRHEERFDLAADAAIKWLTDGAPSAMNQFNGLT